MLQLPRAAVTIDLASGVDCNICNHFFSQTNFDHSMLTFPNIFAWGIKSNNQSLHTCEKDACVSNRFCSRVTETKSVTIAPGLPYVPLIFSEQKLFLPHWMYNWADFKLRLYLMHFYCTDNNFGGYNDGLERNSQSHAMQRKHPRDLLYFLQTLSFTRG